MSATPVQHSIGELARLGGVTPRTIRYYVAQGLLPAPGGVGPGAHYGSSHLERLRLIRRLQRQHLPLAEIRTQLGTLSDDQVAAVNRTEAAAPPAGSALDYVRSVLGDAGPAAPGEPALPAPASPRPSVAAPPPSVPAVARARGLGRFVLRRSDPPALASEVPLAMPRMRDAPPPAEAAATTEPTSLERSQWERLSFGPNLELHVRRPLSRLEQRRVERLITIARQVLREEMP